MPGWLRPSRHLRRTDLVQYRSLVRWRFPTPTIRSALARYERRDGRNAGVEGAFLRDSAHDLLPHMRITSIAPHEAPIRSARGPNQDGARRREKLKARNTAADGRWFGAVIGSDGKPILFERDLQWSNLRCRRSTEQWLNERWIKEREVTYGG